MSAVLVQAVLLVFIMLALSNNFQILPESFHQYCKVIRVFVCMYVYVCVCVCVSLNNSGTTGPIWLNFFLLAPYWSGDGFRQKRFRIRGWVFPKIRKNRIPDPDFFCLKLTCDHTELTKKSLAKSVQPFRSY